MDEYEKACEMQRIKADLDTAKLKTRILEDQVEEQNRCIQDLYLRQANPSNQGNTIIYHAGNVNLSPPPVPMCVDDMYSHPSPHPSHPSRFHFNEFQYPYNAEGTMLNKPPLPSDMYPNTEQQEVFNFSAPYCPMGSSPMTMPLRSPGPPPMTMPLRSPGPAPMAMPLRSPVNMTSPTCTPGSPRMIYNPRRKVLPHQHAHVVNNNNSNYGYQQHPDEINRNMTTDPRAMYPTQQAMERETPLEQMSKLASNLTSYYEIERTKAKSPRPNLKRQPEFEVDCTSENSPVKRIQSIEADTERKDRDREENNLDVSTEHKRRASGRPPMIPNVPHVQNSEEDNTMICLAMNCPVSNTESSYCSCSACKNQK